MRNPRQEYLTWDPTFPGPFESIWSIFVKVIVLNNTTLKTITELVQMWDAPYSPEAVDCASTAWIDFDRFAALLTVRPERLEQGAWPQIGIRPVKPRDGLRRCPECWKTGYHFALFDVMETAACPWHQCRLTRHCKVCLLPKTFKDRACSECGMTFPSRDMLLATARSATPATAAGIATHCASLVPFLNLNKTSHSKPANAFSLVPYLNRPPVRHQPYERIISEREIVEAAARFYEKLGYNRITSQSDDSRPYSSTDGEVP